jgi:hypothetical protein
MRTAPLVRSGSGRRRRRSTKSGANYWLARCTDLIAANSNCPLRAVGQSDLEDQGICDGRIEGLGYASGAGPTLYMRST